MFQFDVEKKYNHNDFVRFLSDFLPDSFEPQNEDIYYDFLRIDGSGNSKILGRCEELDLEVFELLYTSGYDPRVSLTKDVVNYMKNVSSFSNALVVLHSEHSEHWRLSLITTSFEVHDGKISRTYSNPHRFSFLLGKDCKQHTPKSMLFDKHKVESFEDLKSRFAIEVVTKEFFDAYREKYADFVEFITGKRFVKVGGKFEEKTLHDPNKQYVSEFNCDDKAVRDYVKKLFGRLVFLHFLQKKGWLGVEDNEDWGTGDRQFMSNLFSRFNEKESFLEYVLEPLFFDTLNTDRGESSIAPEPVCKAYGKKVRIPYLNGGLFEKDSLDVKSVAFPQKLFRELLEFFDTYNFTIDETDPSDQEIGVDPEMLGKIFENLLEDNKDKGAFYTPKEIVQYMCRESLIAYLLTKVSIPEEKIRDFVINQTVDFSEEEKKALSIALEDVKICDPAVGSGAFPMGIMNELLACRIALTENFSQQKRAQLKKEIVKNNIYGVDIEKGAVDIARLRFWLAIIVDEESPVLLPNLDYKIMQGNSLLESYKEIDLSKLVSGKEAGLFGDEEESAKLIQLTKDFYEPQTQKSKDELRKAINEKALEIVSLSGGSDALKELREINLYENNQFFLWHTWFNDVFNRPNNCNGFDIVIANPPYIDSETMTNLGLEWERKVLMSKFKNLSGNWDIYMAFFELALSLGKTITFITPDKWLSKPFGLQFREKQMKRRLSIITRAGSKVFENATVDAIITIFKEKSDFLEAYEFKNKASVNKVSGVLMEKINSPYLIDFLFSGNSALIQKIDSFDKSLKSLAECENACATSDFYLVKELIEENPNPTSDYYKLINTGTITKYANLWDQKPISYAGKYNFPIVSKKIFEKTLGKSYVSRACQPKLIFKGLNLLDVFLDETADFLPGKSTMVICSSNLNILKFLLGLLNSKLPIFYIKKKYASSSYCGGISFSKDMFNDFPIPEVSNHDFSEIVKIVDQILLTVKNDIFADISMYEKKLNQKIYSIYNLTAEESNYIEEN